MSGLDIPGTSTWRGSRELKAVRRNIGGNMSEHIGGGGGSYQLGSLKQQNSSRSLRVQQEGGKR